MITTKAALIAAMQAAPGCRIYGHTGARPSSHWKYRLQTGDGKDVDTVSAPLVDRAETASDIRIVRRDWLSSEYRLSRRNYAES